MKSQLIGAQAEQTALEFLTARGLHLVKRNFRCKSGEIDLIMTQTDLNQTTLVFVEVRYRKSAAFGGALASVTASKRHRISRAAQHFLQQNRVYRRLPCRFDVVALQGCLARAQPHWLISAFDSR